MNPLDSILSNSNNPTDVLLRYLPDKTYEIIKKKIYYDPYNSDLFLNQKIFCIDKSNGKIASNGTIIKINDNLISIKCNNKHLHINTDDFYIFISQKKSKKNDYEYFQALLNML